MTVLILFSPFALLVMSSGLFPLPSSSYISGFNATEVLDPCFSYLDEYHARSYDLTGPLQLLASLTGGQHFATHGMKIEHYAIR